MTSAIPSSDRQASVLIANPSPDVYGSDLQMLESVRAMVAHDMRATVAIPNDGELVPRLREAGADVVFLPFPVLRRASRSPWPFVRMVLEAVRTLPRIIRHLRRTRPDVLYVNTVTLPWWLLAGRLAGVPTVIHLHEAETKDGRRTRQALMLPVRLADAVIVISRSALTAMCEVAPCLQEKATLIYNGVPFPPAEPTPASHGAPHRLVVVGRLSPRKAPHLALETLAELVRRGLDVQLEVAGTCFFGYEWYEEELRARAAKPDLEGRVTFSGYCSPIWPVLARSQLMVAPSLREPFGNAVVEAQLSRRPVVATAALGHLESIEHDRTGLLVPAGDVTAMADAAQGLIEDPQRAAALAETARDSARERFSTERYGRQIFELLRRVASRA